MGDGIFEGWLGHDSCPIRKISALIKEAQGNLFVHFPTWGHLAGAVWEIASTKQEASFDLGVPNIQILSRRVLFRSDS